MPYLFLVSFLCSNPTFAQEKVAKKQSSAHDISIGSSLATVLFRDEATSPLVYGGVGMQFDLGHRIVGEKYHYLFQFSFLAGITFNDFNEEFATASVFSPQIYAHYVRNVYKLTDKVIWQVGGAIDNRFLIRNNSALMNTQFGLDNIATVFLVNRIDIDVSRKKATVLDYGFIKFTLPERRRRLFYQINTGVLNTAYRNSYSYIVDDPDFPLFDPFSGHTFGLSGFRFQSRIGFEQFLKNGNSISFNYGWDAFFRVGKFEPLAFSQQQIGMTLHFKTK
ncbi:MAG: hypothetical protein LAT76_12355 [Schleiferiaceae bacterium]|nr:hypothetical protein [Schleiferiaceae bacterium]